jgi:ATP-binding cassette subfamily B multidrug efflux pump
MRRYRKALVLGFGALAVKDALWASIMPAMAAGIDALAAHRGFRVVLGFAALMIVLSAAKGVFQYWMRVILIGMSRDVEYDLRNDLFGRLVGLDATFFRRMRTGDILARATNDMNAVRMMLGPGLMYWFETSLMLALAAGVMAYTDWVLTLVALAPAPLVAFTVLVFGRKIHDRFETIQGQFSDISSRVQENLAGVRVVRSYVQEQREIEYFERLNRAYIRESLKLARIDAVFEPLLQALVALAYLLVLGVGGWRASQGKISIGGFVMFNTYLGGLIWPMIAMGWVANLIERGRASLGRVRALLDERPGITAPRHPLAVPLAGEIEFRNVSVRYGDRVALSQVNLTIPAGAAVAIVGHTGSGKSTLANLIPRLLDPSEGAVLLDGLDLRSLDPEPLRRRIGYVPQEAFLFNATLAENIAFGAPQADPRAVLRAAEIAGLGPDLSSFPKGLDTLVGERGITLSGGQKQRTAIARAIARDPRILILDDALASVDTATEERILQQLRGLMRGRTSIVISHRVSTVRNADCIVVMAHGEVVAQGTHKELLRKPGYYSDLARKQMLEEELEIS